MEPYSVTSELRAVTVFRAGAVCTRVAVLDGAAAAHTRIRVLGLPLALASHSLRASVRGADLVVVDVRAAFEVDLGDELDLASERTTLDQARREHARVQRRLERIEHELAELRGLQPRFREPPRSEPPRPAALTSMLALVELVDARQAELAGRRRGLRRELDDAEQAVRLHERRLAESSSASRTERARVGRAAIVTLSGVAVPGAELAIEYEVGGVRWTPSYQLSLGADGRGGRLAMRASIVQRTGEDWRRVMLSLSTASLWRRTELPELHSLRIGRAQPEPRRAGWRAPPPGLDALFTDYDAAILERPPSPSSSLALDEAPRLPPLPGAARPRREQAEGAAAFGRPVPPPSAAPMSAAAPAPMQLARASIAAGGAAAAPQPMRFAAPSEAGATRSRMAKDMFAAEHDGMLDDAIDEPSAVSTFAPSGDQLDYQALRMQGPAAARGRGRLLPSAEISVGVHVHARVIVALVEQARHEAEAIAALPLPRDCIPAIAQDQFDYRYDALAPADVPATGTWVSVAVTDCDLELRPRYLCVPAVESQVYRTLELHNRSALALLPGPVDVVSHGELLLTTSLPPLAPGAAGRRLGLGVEESIKVARNTRFTETTGGIFGGAAVLPHEITIEIDNRLGVAAELEVRERVPVVDAGEKDIEVKEHDVEPPWTAIDTPQDGVLVHGLRRWQLSVPARTKTTLTAKFTIRMPADRMLVGGNRRS